jgi:hypothetical protein
MITKRYIAYVSWRRKHLAVPDLSVVFPYDEAHAKAGLLAT